ncbi:hypothetical protein Acsp07_55920 [Actinomycetospora sp. NBRC 106378]|nr:hypothetical protein Acsp07_55920 [Actinomycetospora sp. NBRC 106378]
MGRRRAQLPPLSALEERGEHVAESLATGARVVVPGAINARSWAPTEGGRSGETLTRPEATTAETVAASL